VWVFSVTTVLLTGATGFLGSHLLEALLNKGYQVVILKRSTSNTWRIEHLLKQVVSYDIDCADLKLAFIEQQIHVVIHTACNYGRNGEFSSEIVDTNLMFGLRLIDASIKYNTNAFVNTDTILHKNLNTYTLSKKQLVEWLEYKSTSIRVVNLKIEHMYGEKDDDTKFVPWLIDQLDKGVAEIKLTSGEQLRDFIYIQDVISAYLIVLKQSEVLPRFSEFEVGTGCSISVKTFVHKLKDCYESEYGAIHSGFSFGKVPLREGEDMNVKIDNSGLISMGWQPSTSIDNGIVKLLQGRLSNLL